jgi:SAM-dependent methyltransferase
MAATDPIYAMGYSAEETQRLIAQSQLYTPFTRQLFIEAGIGRGMRVLDVGSGAGDVALLAAELVGPSGHVVGVDSNAAILGVARARAQALGFGNIELVAADIRDLAVGQAFDAVVSRFILIHQRDPAETLRLAAGHLRPGGVIVSQEHDPLSEAMSAPPSPLLRQARLWARALAEQLGMSADVAFNLHRHYVAAGLPAPQLRMDAPIGSVATWGGYAQAEGSLRSLLPLLERHGIATAAEVDVDTFATRLYAEIGAHGGMMRGTPVIGAWARIP